LMRYGTSQVMPVYYVLFTLASICGSVVLYHEFAVVSGTRRLIFLAGCCITFFGVILITGNRDSECSTDVATEETDDALLEFLGPSSSMEDRERVHAVLLSGGIGLALGLVLTPVCFPMFLCCSTLLGAGVGGAAAEHRYVPSPHVPLCTARHSPHSQRQGRTCMMPCGSSPFAVVMHRNSR
jgi:hypothetical protein